jgi:hypothetical protein
MGAKAIAVSESDRNKYRQRLYTEDNDPITDMEISLNRFSSLFCGLLTAQEIISLKTLSGNLYRKTGIAQKSG